MASPPRPRSRFARRIGYDWQMKQFRFSLRTLILAITAGAVLCWAYWFGWPWWKNREYRLFLESAKTLKVGMTEEQASQLIQGVDRSRVFNSIMYSSPESITPHKPTKTVFYVWDDRIYCVYYMADYRAGGGLGSLFDWTSPCDSIEVFRLAPRPVNYQNAPNPRRGEIITRPPPPYRNEDVIYCYYLQDFAVFISGDRKNNSGFEYELIYSDFQD
jgi:hypothetical protein